MANLTKLNTQRISVYIGQAASDMYNLKMYTNGRAMLNITCHKKGQEALKEIRNCYKVHCRKLGILADRVEIRFDMRCIGDNRSFLVTCYRSFAGTYVASRTHIQGEFRTQKECVTECIDDMIVDAFATSEVKMMSFE